MLYSDEAIVTNKDDLLDRGKFAKSTAHALLEMTYDGTYTVGLFGKWGSGKTSLLNMILQEIHAFEEKLDPSDRTIIVHFEPWNFSSTDQLLTQFFIRLISEFSSSSDKKLRKVAAALQSYSFAFDLTKALPYVGGAVHSAISRGIEKFANHAARGANEKDITKQRDNVIQLLKDQDKRLLIVIDDIDRLSNDQIRCVFQLVTSVARFPKTTYLLAFDKDIVTKALEEVQKGKGEDYLEKIIQVPIQLPLTKRGKLRDVLFNRLDKLINETPKLSFSEEYWQELFPVCVDPFIKNLRDVNRLCNALFFKLQTIAEEINFADMTAITVIEVNYPEIYQWISCNKDVLTGEISTRLIGSSRWKEEDWNKLTYDQWREILADDPAAVQRVADSICSIFPAIGNKIKAFSMAKTVYNDQQLRKGNHIGHAEKFDRYFELSLNDDSVSRSDIVKILEIFSEDEFIHFLKETDKTGKTYELLEELNANLSDVSPKRAEIIGKALFRASASFDKTPRGFLMMSSSRYAENVLLKLFEALPGERVFQLLSEITQTADSATLEMIAVFLNLQELANGQLAAQGKPSDIPNVLSGEELTAFETVFCSRIKDYIAEKPLLEFDDCRMIMYLLECFDSAFLHSYLNRQFSDPTNIIRYLEYSAAKWIGGGVSYEIQDDYKKFLDDDQIISAIERCRKERTLFALPEKAQLMAAAFWLHFHNKYDYEKHILEKSAMQVLNTWRQ